MLKAKRAHDTSMYLVHCIETSNSYMQDTFARARTRPNARVTIGYLVYKSYKGLLKVNIWNVRGLPCTISNEFRDPTIK